MHTCARRECVCECVHFDAPARFHVSLLFPLVSETRLGERGWRGEEEEEEEIEEGDHPRGNGRTDRRRDGTEG